MEMNSFLELLEPQNEKITLGEGILAKQKFPERVTRPLPMCLYNQDSEIDDEVFAIIVWIMARRENHDITEAEVNERIGIGSPGKLKEIVKRVHFFVTSHSWEIIEEQFADVEVGEDPETKEEDAENPTQEPN